MTHKEKRAKRRTIVNWLAQFNEFRRGTRVPFFWSIPISLASAELNSIGRRVMQTKLHYFPASAAERALSGNKKVDLARGELSVSSR
jgi:hypothetical protein